MVENYTIAADRKINIAKYHCEYLLKELKENSNNIDGMPAIEIQACFEGVILSVIASIDQVAQAINSGLKLSLWPGDLVNTSFSILSEEIPDLKEWFENPFGIDLRRIRTRMMHYSYEKLQQGECWTVEVGNKKYKGDRDLENYAKTALCYGNRLAELTPEIKKYLSDKQSQD